MLNKILKISLGLVLLALGIFCLITELVPRHETYSIILVGLFLSITGDKAGLARLFLEWKSSLIGILSIVASWYLIKNHDHSLIEVSPLIAVGLFALGMKDAIPFFNRNNNQANEN